MVVLGGGAFSHERGTPVTQTLNHKRYAANGASEAATERAQAGRHARQEEHRAQAPQRTLQESQAQKGRGVTCANTSLTRLEGHTILRGVVCGP